MDPQNFKTAAGQLLETLHNRGAARAALVVAHHYQPFECFQQTWSRPDLAESEICSWANSLTRVILGGRSAGGQAMVIGEEPAIADAVLDLMRSGHRWGVLAVILSAGWQMQGCYYPPRPAPEAADLVDPGPFPDNHRILFDFVESVYETVDHRCLTLEASGGEKLDVEK